MSTKKDRIEEQDSDESNLIVENKPLPINPDVPAPQQQFSKNILEMQSLNNNVNQLNPAFQQTQGQQIVYHNPGNQQMQGQTGMFYAPGTQWQPNTLPNPQIQQFAYTDPNMQYQQGQNFQPGQYQNFQPSPLSQQGNFGVPNQPIQNQVSDEENRLQQMFVDPPNNTQSEGALGLQKFCGNALNCVCFPIFVVFGINRVKIGPSEIGIRLRGGAFDAYLRSGIYYVNSCLHQVRVVDCRTEMMEINSSAILTSDNVQLH